ncbi:hypothetical protein DSO57_1020156 [Entomophthora muscae]|uniref:Uncharacterized protein n=2 Tax=Entomophthora muscae TaxID=34485 RepID=A0ACC2RID4_9FUNG|nr:hypothetical protein DSO57_1020156 [Entomophthora muscae]
MFTHAQILLKMGKKAAGTVLSLTVAAVEAKVVLGIVHLLIPRYLVPEKAFFLIIGSLSVKTNEYAQHLLLRWMAALLQMGHSVESTALLQRTYAILFHFLIYDHLRPYVAHILYIITRPHHVQPYRIRHIMSLQARFPGDIYLLGLMAFYKQACPGRVVLGRGLPRPARVFSMVSPLWQPLASKMWMSWNGVTQGLDVSRRLGLKLGPSDAGVGFRRRKEVELSLPIGITTAPKAGQLSLYLLPTWEELLLSIDALALPDCSAAYLGDRHLQLYMMCFNPEDATEGWLTHALRDATLWTDQTTKNSRALSRLLVNLVSCARRTGRVPLGVKHVLGSYLMLWNGTTHQSLLLELISYYPPAPFQELYSDIISPLLRFAPTCSSPQFSARILGVFVSLLRRWMHYKPPLQSHVEPFVAHVNKFASISLQLEKDHPLLVHQTLVWIELLADLFPVHGVSLKSFPSTSLFNLLFLTAHGGMTVSRVCGSLARFALYFRPLPETRGPFNYISKEQSYFSSVVIDYIDVLWRLNGFCDKRIDGAVRFAFELPSNFEPVVQKQVERQANIEFDKFLSLTVSPCFVLLAHSFLSSRDKGLAKSRMSKPLTPFCFASFFNDRAKSKKAFNEFRNLFLSHLWDLGFHGMREFIQTFTSHSTGQ